MASPRNLTMAALLCMVLPVTPMADETKPGDGAATKEYFAGTVSLGGVFADVKDDEARFREDHQVPDGFSGGLTEFTYRGEGKNDVKLELSGRLQYEYNSGVDLTLSKKDLGYVRIKADGNRRYYDSTGLYYPYAPFVYSLGDDLHTDTTTFNAEVGLTLPDVPKLVLGYERTERTGDTNLPYGGWIRQSPGNDWILWLNPLSQEVDDSSDRFYISAEHPVGPFTLSARQELEWFDGHKEHVEPGYYITGTKVFDRYYVNDYDTRMALTTLNAKGDVVEDKLHLDLTYVFRNITNDNDGDVDSYTPAGARHYGEHSFNFLNNDHEGDGNLHRVKLMLNCTAIDRLSIFGGAQYKQGRDSSDSRREEDGSEATAADGNPLTVDEIWYFDTVNKTRGLTETFGVTSAHIPKTKVTLQADFEQERVNYDWDATIQEYAATANAGDGNEGDWAWDSDNTYKRQRYTLSIRSRPTSWLSPYLRYRYKLDETDVDEDLDYAEQKTGDPEYETSIPTDYYYPGRMGDRTRTTHEFVMSVDLNPCQYITLKPTYSRTKSTYEVDGEPQEEISEYNAESVGLAVDLKPTSQVLLSLFGTLNDVETETEAETTSRSVGTDPIAGAPSAGYFGALTPAFDGSSTVLGATGSYVYKRWRFSAHVDRTAGEGNFDTELLGYGVSATCRLNEQWEIQSKFVRYQYDEDDNGGVNDYDANVFSVGATARF